jgi:hypothetical protein
MSGVSPLDTDRRTIAPRIPWYVYAVAILLLGWAALRLVVWFSMTEEGSRYLEEMFRIGLDLAIGFGLLLRRRSAWVLGVVVSVITTGVGLLGLIVERNREYGLLYASTAYLIPGILVLVVLLTPAARRAYSDARLD